MQPLGNADLLEGSGQSALFLTGDVLARKVIVDEKPAVVGVGGADGDDLHNHEMRTKMMHCGGLQYRQFVSQSNATAQVEPVEEWGLIGPCR